jgi:hypothetical protein
MVKTVSKVAKRSKPKRTKNRGIALPAAPPARPFHKLSLILKRHAERHTETTKRHTGVIATSQNAEKRHTGVIGISQIT